MTAFLLLTATPCDSAQAQRSQDGDGSNFAGVGVRNESRIRIVDVVKENDVELLFVCLGAEHYAEQLKGIGLTSEQLASRVTCVAGDFDGNGDLDFAIWGAAVNDINSGALFRKFMVLFFEAGTVLRTQAIVNRNRDHLWLYHPQCEPNEFGSPVSDLPGLVQSGEGGTTYYFIYDAGSGKLKRYETLSEWW